MRTYVHTQILVYIRAFPHMQIEHPSKCILSVCTPTETFSIRFAPIPILRHLVPVAPGALVETPYPPTPLPATSKASDFMLGHSPRTCPPNAVFGW